MRRPRGFTHEATQNETDHWLTPPEILGALGEFDLDPCACAMGQPWPTAREHFRLPEQDGLLLAWSGRVWCNPPYGRELGKWIDRMALHANGVMLIFGRYDTQQFKPIWKYADALLFLEGRVRFRLPPDGRLPENGGGAGAPSVLVAFGQNNVEALSNCGLRGALVTGWRMCERKRTVA